MTAETEHLHHPDIRTGSTLEPARHLTLLGIDRDLLRRPLSERITKRGGGKSADTGGRVPPAINHRPAVDDDSHGRVALANRVELGKLFGVAGIFDPEFAEAGLPCTTEAETVFERSAGRSGDERRGLC